MAGIALPLQDRLLGAVVVLGEKYSPSGPVTLVGLDAKVGPWGDVENAIAQFRREMKFNYAIVEKDEYRKVLWQMQGLKYGQAEIPVYTGWAERYAVAEIGRSYVDALVAEGRLILDEPIQKELGMEPQMGAVALQIAACWIRERPAVYSPLKKAEPRQGQILGMAGLS